MMSSFNRLRIIVAGILAFTAVSSVVHASEPRTLVSDNALFGFGGVITADDDNPLAFDYEQNFVLGLGFQRFHFDWNQNLLNLGIVGLAGRFGDRDSAEVWGGAVARYDGLVLFERLRVSPAFTFGLSAVTDTLEGREEHSEVSEDGDATVLFYLGPELNISLPSHPEIELFARVHHRSGAWGTLGDMHGAANASVIGFRRRF
jgi:hypothetical protein